MAVLAVNIGDIMKEAMIMGYEYIEKAAILSKCEEMWNNADETTQTGVDTINAIDRITDWIEAMPAADVQPTEKVEEYRRLLEECERKFRYLLECEIESSSESIEVKKLIKKIQSCSQNNYGGG